MRSTHITGIQGWAGALAAALLLLPATARAVPIEFEFDSGDRSASATFVQSGSTLTITLANTSTADTMTPTDVLTALFFSIAGNPVLTPDTATVPSGSAVLDLPSGTDLGFTDVSGEWAFATGLSVDGATMGVSAVGLDLFSPGDRFDTDPASNLSGSAAVGGLDYSLLSAGDDPATGNLANIDPLIKNTVVFTFTGLDPNVVLGEGDITNVSFNFGTELAPGPGVPAPEPGTLLALGLGLVAIWFTRRRLLA